MVARDLLDVMRSQGDEDQLWPRRRELPERCLVGANDSVVVQNFLPDKPELRHSPVEARFSLGSELADPGVHQRDLRRIVKRPAHTPAMAAALARKRTAAGQHAHPRAPLEALLRLEPAAFGLLLSAAPLEARGQ